MERRLSLGKMILLIVSAIVILVIAQVLALAVGNALVTLGIPAAAGNLLTGILYPVVALALAFLLCDKILHITTNECKITRFSLKPIWCVTAFVMPGAVSAILLLTNGHWENNMLSSADTWVLITGAVTFYGLGTGIVEELVFRGLIMSALEMRFNKAAAVIAPSVLFGALHVIGNDLDMRSVAQLLVAGSMVGILLSIVAYESGNIWNGALIHAVWNIIMIGTILHIGDTADKQAIYNYVLDTDSFLLTGGDFGVEASVVSVGAYLFFAVLAWMLYRRRVSDAGAGR